MILAPGAGEIAAALASRAESAGVEARLAVSPEGAAVPGSLPWNPASYVSAGALFLAAGPGLDTLVLVCDPFASRLSLFDGAPGSLGQAIEGAVAGPAYLLREAVRRFDARKSGRIVLVADEKSPEAQAAAEPGSSALANLVLSAFRGLGEGLFDRAKASPWTATGVLERSGRPEALADFVFRLLEEPKTAKSGRWLPFSGKTGIFGLK